MAIQTYQSRPGLGERLGEGLASGLGSSLGQGLGRGLTSLAELGASTLAEKVGISGPKKEQLDFLTNQGLSPEEAIAFYKLDPRAQQQVLANLGQQRQQEQRQALFSQEQEVADEATQGLEEIDDELLSKLIQSGASSEDLSGLLSQYQKSAAEEKRVKPEFIESPSDVYKKMIGRGADNQIARDAAGAQKEEYKEEKARANEYISAAQKEAKAAKKNNANLERMYELVQRGNLTPAATGTVLNALEKGIHGLINVGVDLHGLTSTDTQEFKKLSTDFIKGAKDLFGARVTEGEIKLLLQTVPSLTQSDEAKLRLINTLYNANQAAILTDKAVKDIKSIYRGRTPKNIEELVQDRIGDQLDVLANNIKKGISDLPGYKKAAKKASTKSTAESVGGLGGGAAGGLGGFLAGGIPGGALGALAGLYAGSQAPGVAGIGQGESLSEYGIEPGIEGLFGPPPVA